MNAEGDVAVLNAKLQEETQKRTDYELAAKKSEMALRDVSERLEDAERAPLCAALLSPYSANLKIESLKPLAPAASKP